MNHKITIKNLGPIKDITDFEVRRVNAVIGESATGKSLLAKAIYCFNNSELLGDMMEGVDSAKKELASVVGEMFGAYSKFSITYCYTDDDYIEVSDKGDIEFSAKLSARIGEAIAKFEELELDAQVRHYQETLVRASQQGFTNEEVIRLLEDMPVSVTAGAKVRGQFVTELGIADAIFVPDSRSFVTAFDDMRLERFSKPGASLRSRADDNVILTLFSEVYRRCLANFKSLDHPLMRGTVQKVGGRGIKLIVGDQVLDISETSSGQQRLFPILMILQAVLRRESPVLLIVEELEAHIYPEDQKKLLDYIIEVANATGSSVFLTTHSPYVLMALNNLLEAKSRGYPKLKDRFVDINEINVRMLKDGTAEELIERDPEEELIDLGPIESVDDKIVDEFHDILNYGREEQEETGCGGQPV